MINMLNFSKLDKRFRSCRVANAIVVGGKYPQRLAKTFAKKEDQQRQKNKFQEAFDTAPDYFRNNGINSPNELKTIAKQNRLLNSPVLNFISVK